MIDSDPGGRAVAAGGPVDRVQAARKWGSLRSQWGAFVLLAVVLFVGSGFYYGPTVLAGTLVAGVALTAALVISGRPGREPGSLPDAVLGWSVVLLCAVQLVKPAGWYLDGWADVTLRALFAVAALLGVVFTRGAGSRRRTAFFALCVLAIGMRALVLIGSPEPRIDMWSNLQHGAAGLLRGENPYSMTFPDVYGGEMLGVPVDAYQYPPLTLLLALPGYVATGDVRASMLLLELASMLMVYGIGLRRLRRRGDQDASWFSLATATLLWAMHPRGLFVLEQSWTEPMITFCLVLFLYLEETGRPLAAACAIGLFASSKQYAVLLLPFVLMVRRDPRVIAAAAATALAVNLPFFLWSPGDFWSDVVLFHLSTPFRDDGLTVNSLLWDVWGFHLADWVGPAAALVAMAACLRGVRDHSTMIHRMVIVMLVLLLASKQAFCNYYYLTASLIAIMLILGITGGTSPAARARPAS